MRRSLVGLALAVAVLVPGIAAADQATYAGYPVVMVNVNGTVLQPDVPAIVVNGRTLLPVRAVAEALGADVQWDQATQTATVHGAETFNADQPFQDPSNANNPLNGKSMLCALASNDLSLLKGATADNLGDVESRVGESIVLLDRFPKDSVDASFALQFSAILPYYLAATDDHYVDPTDPDASKKATASKYLAATAQEQFQDWEQNYADGPGKGKDPCGAVVTPGADPWTSITA